MLRKYRGVPTRCEDAVKRVSLKIMRSRGHSSYPRYTYSLRVSCTEWYVTLTGIFFSNVSRAPVDLGLLYEVPRSHSGTPRSVGVPWTSDSPITETSTWQHSQETLMPAVGFEPKISAGERPQNYALDRAGTNSHMYRSITACASVFGKVSCSL